MRFLLSVIIIFLVSCSSENYETRAKIIERKILPDSQLMIRYSFSVGNKVFFDSIRTGNKVIPHDSLKVVYSASDPTRNTLKFE